MIVRWHVGFSSDTALKEEKLKIIANNKKGISLPEQKPSSKSIQSGILKKMKINYPDIHVDEQELQLLWYYLRGSSMTEKNFHT